MPALVDFVAFICLQFFSTNESTIISSEMLQNIKPGQIQNRVNSTTGLQNTGCHKKIQNEWSPHFICQWICHYEPPPFAYLLWRAYH